MTEKQRELDDLTVSTEHAEVMHPLRALKDHHFYVDGVISSEGGMWLLLIDALLFVPFMMAVLFYPLASFLWLIVVLLVTFAIYVGMAQWKKRRRIQG